MKKIILSIAFVASLAGCAAHVQPNIDHLLLPEPRWTYIDSSHSLDIIAFVEETSRYREGQFAYVWGATVTTKAKDKTDTSTGLLKFNCDTRHVSSVVERDYKKGQKVRDVMIEPDRWNYVDQGSVYEKYYRVACFNERFDNRGVVIEGSIQAYWQSIQLGLRSAQEDAKKALKKK